MGINKVNIVVHFHLLQTVPVFSRSGKTSIIKLIFEKMTAGETLQLPETKMIQIHGNEYASICFTSFSTLQNSSVEFIYVFKSVMYPVHKLLLFSTSTPIHLNVQPSSLFSMQRYEILSHVYSSSIVVLRRLSRKTVQIQLVYW